MVRPETFRRNEATLPSNRFQARTVAAEDPAAAARSEFDELATLLTRHGVSVRVFEGRPMSILPDEVFPNNWVSLHEDGTAVLYPLMAWNRRPERRADILDVLQREDGYRIDRVVDLTHFENVGHFLEGTGSIVIDRLNAVVYACLSPRTHVEALKGFARNFDYEIVVFEASDRDGFALYHTNVLLTLGSGFAVFCSEAIRDVVERHRILSRLERGNREVVDLTFAQLHSFAGNMIELQGPAGKLIALSRRAFQSLTEAQRRTLRRYATLLPAPVDTIETHGGGSVRCMLAEIFLPRRRGQSD